MSGLSPAIFCLVLSIKLNGSHHSLSERFQLLIQVLSASHDLSYVTLLQTHLHRALQTGQRQLQGVMGEGWVKTNNTEHC